MYENCANSILVKVNQVGSVSETIKSMLLAKENNYSSLVSHRSGETEDPFISHLSVGTSSGEIIGFDKFNIHNEGIGSW